MSEASSYTLSIGQTDEARMSELNRLYNPPTKELILSSGLCKGMKVLDIACGTGIMTKWLAEQVGPKGQVYAIDENKQQLAIAKKNTLGMSNITFEKCSVYEMSHLINSFDSVYCRFLLVHLDNPVEALRQMITALKPGGKIIIVSALHEAYFSEPKNTAFDKFFNLALEVISQGSHDVHFGKKLIPVLKSLDIEIEASQFFMPILESQKDKRFVKLNFNTIYNQCLNKGITKADIDKIDQELLEFANDPKAYGTFADCILVCGKK